MKDGRARENVVRQLRHPVPGQAVALAAPTERTQPQHRDMVAECRQGATVGRHGVIVEEAGDDGPQPLPLLGIG